MAINLNKNRQSLVNTWKEVVDDKNPMNWALFGYEGQTNDLKVVSKGDGGIEEMTEDLNSGKIMYGFVKVMDPKTSLPKCVLINWQGEGAPLVRKGVCANHIHDVAKLFSGAHVTINARNEDEVDMQIIIDKVAKAGSAYSFKTRSEPEKSDPVGTIYKRVNPIQEINTSERDRFWEKEEMEEKERRAEEHRKKREEQQKLEAERLRYEEKTRNLMQQREEQWNAQHPAPKVSSQNVIKHHDHEQSTNGSSTTSPVSVTQPVATSPTSLAFSSTNAPMQFSTSNGSSHVPMQISPDSATAEDEDNFEEQEWKVSQRDSSAAAQSPITMDQQATSSDEAAYQAQAAAAAALTEGMAELQYGTPSLHHSVTQDDEDLGLRARALYDYQAADATEISFDPDDIITHIDMIDEGWWQGLGPDGTFGLFPANYVELIEE